jgi:hypothetical protein
MPVLRPNCHSPGRRRRTSTQCLSSSPASSGRSSACRAGTRRLALVQLNRLSGAPTGPARCPRSRPPAHTASTDPANPRSAPGSAHAVRHRVVLCIHTRVCLPPPVLDSSPSPAPPPLKMTCPSTILGHPPTRVQHTAWMARIDAADGRLAAHVGPGYPQDVARLGRRPNLCRTSAVLGAVQGHQLRFRPETALLRP